MSTEPARVAVAERWAVLRRGLVGLLDGVHTVVGDVDDLAGLRAVVATQPVDLAVVGDDAGIDLVQAVGDLRRRCDVPTVVVLCDEMDAGRLRELLRVGALGVFSKKVDDAALLDGVARVLAGDRVIDQSFIPLLFGAHDLEDDGADGSSLLTPRERDVLRLLARGCTNREIADVLVLAESTIKTHLRRIYDKLDVDGRHHAVGRAMELGLLR